MPELFTQRLEIRDLGPQVQSGLLERYSGQLGTDFLPLFWQTNILEHQFGQALPITGINTAIMRWFEGMLQIGMENFLPGRGGNKVDLFQILVNQLTQQADLAESNLAIEIDPALIDYKAQIAQGFLRIFNTHTEFANQLWLEIHNARINNSLLPALWLTLDATVPVSLQLGGNLRIMNNHNRELMHELQTRIGQTL